MTGEAQETNKTMSRSSAVVVVVVVVVVVAVVVVVVVVIVAVFVNEHEHVHSIKSTPLGLSLSALSTNGLAGVRRLSDADAVQHNLMGSTFVHFSSPSNFQVSEVGQHDE